MNAPCYGCGRRQAGCHASCPDYQAFRADRERISKMKMAENESRQAYFRPRNKKVWKRMKEGITK